MQTERLSTLDEYGNRRFVIPAEVSGRFRNLRDRTYATLIVIFLALPWIYINGLQAVKLDLPNRRFEIFGILFLAHDAPLVFLIFIIATMLLAFITAVWGRVWCGWACPQTVFIDGLYRKIEILIEGNYITRRQLRNAPMNFSKAFKISLKWFAFFILSSLISHSFIAYFSGSRELISMITGSPNDNWTYFLLVSIITAILMFNFGWFREQFCTIMCPYGRFQSVLMDDHSLAIVYDTKRGEPRKSPTNKNHADCVSCNRCVEVCPAGIDIRNGVQMECIACTACIDACNIIMRKINKPDNLISYQSLSPGKLKIWRLRTITYATIIGVATITLIYTLATRRPYSVNILRAKDIPYQPLQEDRILNHLKAHFVNQSQNAQEFEISIQNEYLAQGVTLTKADQVISLEPGKGREVHLFITFPKELTEQTGDATFPLIIKEKNSSARTVENIKIVGPRGK